jgi:hypothetical protein
MLIRASTHFRHGRVQFARGITYDVPERAGGYFVGNGWAAEAPADGAPVVTPPVEDLTAEAPQPPQPVVTLDVQDVIHSTDTPQAGG